MISQCAEGTLGYYYSVEAHGSPPITFLPILDVLTAPGRSAGSPASHQVRAGGGKGRQGSFCSLLVHGGEMVRCGAGQQGVHRVCG